MVSLQFSLETPKNDPLKVQITFSLFDLKHSCEKARQESICKYLLTCLLRLYPTKTENLATRFISNVDHFDKEHVPAPGANRTTLSTSKQCANNGTQTWEDFLETCPQYIWRSLETFYRNNCPLYPNLSLPYTYVLYTFTVFKWDSDQHESLRFFGHCAHIKKFVDHIYFSTFVYLLFCKPSCAVSTSLVRTNLNLSIFYLAHS